MRLTDITFSCSAKIRFDCETTKPLHDFSCLYALFCNEGSFFFCAPCMLVLQCDGVLLPFGLYAESQRFYGLYDDTGIDASGNGYHTAL